MNVKATVTALKGHHILILTNKGHGFVHGQPCIRVHDLLPRQRQPDQGNVILWDGRFTQDGFQAGGTFWARDARSIVWHHNLIARIHTHHDTKISVIKLWKLSHGKQKGDQAK